MPRRRKPAHLLLALTNLLLAVGLGILAASSSDHQALFWAAAAVFTIAFVGYIYLWQAGPSARDDT